MTTYIHTSKFLKSDYELEGEDCSKLHEEIVKIMAYDPIEKIKTSKSLQDVFNVLNFCRKIAKATLCTDPTLVLSTNTLVLSGDVLFLLKVKMYAAMKLKRAVINEASRNPKYKKICQDKHINRFKFWKELALEEGIE
jgi:hypothetical protein